MKTERVTLLTSREFKAKKALKGGLDEAQAT